MKAEAATGTSIEMTPPTTMRNEATASVAPSTATSSFPDQSLSGTAASEQSKPTKPIAIVIPPNNKTNPTASSVQPITTNSSDLTVQCKLSLFIELFPLTRKFLPLDDASVSWTLITLLLIFLALIVILFAVHRFRKHIESHANLPMVIKLFFLS